MIQSSRFSSRHSHRDFLKSQSVIRRRKKKRLVGLILRGILILGVIILLLSATRLDTLSIKKVVVVGSDTSTHTLIQSIAESALTGSYVALVPRRNTLFYPKQAIIKNILHAVPRIQDVALSTEGFDVLNIKVQERVPVALWCSNGSTCFLVDEQSFIYATDTEATLHAHKLITIYGGSVSTSTNPIGQFAFDTATFSNMLLISQAFASSSLPVEAIQFKDIDSMTFGIQDNGIIMISGRRPIGESVSNIESALRSSVFSTSSKFEYMDARFGNKVFYRLKNSPLVSGIIATTSSTTTKKR